MPLELALFEKVILFSFTANMNGTKKEAFYIGRIEIQMALTWLVGCNTKVKSISDPFRQVIQVRAYAAGLA